MDRSTNCRSQIASSRRNSKLARIRRSRRCRRHRRNPAPLASGNEILSVDVWSVGLDFNCPRRWWQEEGDGCVQRAAGGPSPRASTDCSVSKRPRSDGRSDDILTRRSCVALRVAIYSDKRQNESPQLSAHFVYTLCGGYTYHIDIVDC